MKENWRQSEAAAQEKILHLETEARKLEAKQLDLGHEVARLTEVR
jgi:hypothetical protein